MTIRFWLYVGQVSVLRLRIQTHNDPRHRWKNMGLHYAVWRSDPELKSKFVTLATLAAPSCAQTQLILNLAEMWMCLVFQTLTSIHLSSWLPAQANAMWSGNHLKLPCHYGRVSPTPRRTKSSWTRLAAGSLFNNILHLRIQSFGNGRNTPELLSMTYVNRLTWE